MVKLSYILIIFGLKGRIPDQAGILNSLAYMKMKVNSSRNTCCFHVMRKSASHLKARGKIPTTIMLTSVLNPENCWRGPGSGRLALT